MLNLYHSINNDIKKIADINLKIFTIFNNLTKFEKTKYIRLNFLGNKRNSDTYNKFYFEKTNNFNKLNTIKNKMIESNNENGKTEFLQKKINSFNNLNKLKKNKKFWNNEKKIIKNNKTVYMNKFLIKEDKKTFRTNWGNKRCSKYRGVSKNGSGWQVLMMHKRNKLYIGTYYSEELAARIYDIASIKRIGINAKTNFLYNNEQISRILKTNLDFKSLNISKIISELIK